MRPEPRDRARRKLDTLDRLRDEVDLWIPSVDEHGHAYLVPLSFLWHEGSIYLATRPGTPTARNLRGSPRTRLALGHTRDVVMIDGSVEFIDREDIDDAVASTFAAKLWDARADPKGYVFLRLVPERIQAWREENELAERELMRDGYWVV